MTTDKLTNALIAILEPVKPDASITVVDARQLANIDLPTIAVDVGDTERHSLAMPGVQKCQVTITLRVHSGDGDSRATLKTWADEIEKTLNSPTAIRDEVNASGLGVQCDFLHMGPGETSWDETIFEAAFSGEAWIVRTS